MNLTGFMSSLSEKIYTLRKFIMRFLLDGFTSSDQFGLSLSGSLKCLFRYDCDHDECFKANHLCSRYLK